tara:strand:- start:10586 stop:11053 length:468 start_codon:yes stop_codon:yes gene_type:complete
MIYGIGLPRTGTASLTEALKTMGKQTTHYCVLHDSINHEQYDLAPLNTLAKVDNSFYREYEDLILEHNHALFILTTRNKNSWAKSISRFSEKPPDLPDIEEYTKNVKNVFQSIGAENRLLIVNIFEDEHVFKKISMFLGVTYNKEKMPHIKRELI